MLYFGYQIGRALSDHLFFLTLTLRHRASSVSRSSATRSSATRSSAVRRPLVRRVHVRRPLVRDALVCVWLVSGRRLHV